MAKPNYRWEKRQKDLAKKKKKEEKMQRRLEKKQSSEQVDAEQSPGEEETVVSGAISDVA
jgi:hypothetical protein